MCDIVFHLTQFKVHYRTEPEKNTRKKQQKKINRKEINNISIESSRTQETVHFNNNKNLRNRDHCELSTLLAHSTSQFAHWYSGKKNTLCVCLALFSCSFTLAFDLFPILHHISSCFFFIHIFFRFGTEDRVLNWEIIIIKHQWLLRGQL